MSVVIPSYNEGTWVEKTVRETLSHDDGYPIEIIVVDDGSIDGSCDFLQADALLADRTRLVRRSHGGNRRARNAGADHSRGEYIIFLDAHVAPDSGWIAELVDTLSDSSVALAGCRIGDISNRQVSHSLYVFVNESFRSGWAQAPDSESRAESPCVPGGCMAVRKSTFEALGHWDEGHAKWGLDFELSIRAWRMGYRCLMSPHATVWHWYRDMAERPASVPWVEFDADVLRCLLLHFSGRRMDAVLHGIKQRPSFAQSWHTFQQDPDYEKRRADLQSRFTRSEDWYFEKFSRELEPFERRVEELLEDKEKQQREIDEMLRAKSGASSGGV